MASAAVANFNSRVTDLDVFDQTRFAVLLTGAEGGNTLALVDHATLCFAPVDFAGLAAAGTDLVSFCRDSLEVSVVRQRHSVGFFLLFLGLL